MRIVDEASKSVDVRANVARFDLAFLTTDYSALLEATM